MASIFKYIIIVLFLVTAFSCNVSEIETEIEIPYQGDFLVVHGFISQDDGVYLTLQKTKPHKCRNCSDGVSNAVVSLYEDGVYLLDLQTGDGYFYFSPDWFIPVLGKKYHIKAEADKIQTAVSSSVSLMQVVPIDTAYVEVTENPYRMKICFSFFDISNERNHYIVKVFSGNEHGFKWNKHFLYNKAIGDEVAIYGKIEGETIHFRDNDDATVWFVLYHLSPQLVQFIYSREENFYSEDDPFAEYPVPVYNNISNGYGFFGSYEKDIYVITF